MRPLGFVIFVIILILLWSLEVWYTSYHFAGDAKKILCETKKIDFKHSCCRILTYYQMAEAILHPVRQGQNVVAIYYGHPGIFVYARHRAIQIAHKQGLKAKMLPGVSALDCLFADLGVDPSYPGLQVLEATDFLLRKRKILTDGHFVLLQVSKCKNVPISIFFINACL